MEIWNKIQVKIRLIFFSWFRQGKVPNDISIFCNNCIGAFVAHDYHLPFNSPYSQFVSSQKIAIE